MSTRDFTSRYSRSFTAVRLRTQTFPNLNFNLRSVNLKKNHFVYASVVILLIAAFLFGRYFSKGSGALLGSNDIRENAPVPVATQILNKNFTFPLLDQKGKEVSRISYFLESANLQDAFIYQGKLAKAVKGRTFLIFNLKITNPYSKTIEINAKDYMRVKMNGKNEQLASEIHNDPVEIQANSTKYTRIGLPINDTDKNIVILVGELSGSKETVSLNLQR